MLIRFHGQRIFREKRRNKKKTHSQKCFTVYTITGPTRKQKRRSLMMIHLGLKEPPCECKHFIKLAILWPEPIAKWFKIDFYWEIKRGNVDVVWSEELSVGGISSFYSFPLLRTSGGIFLIESHELADVFLWIVCANSRMLLSPIPRI